MRAPRRAQSLSGLTHVADWFATFSELAGLGAAAPADGPSPPESLSLWPYLSGANATSPRAEVVHDHYMFDNESSGSR